MRPGAARPPVEIQGRQCLPVASFRFPHSQDIRPGRASRRPRPCHGGNDEPQRFAPATIPGDGVGGAGERSPGGRPVIACRPASAPQARQGREGRTTGRGSPAGRGRAWRAAAAAGARRARAERARISAHRSRAARCGCLSRSHGAWGAARGRRAVSQNVCSERLRAGASSRPFLKTAGITGGYTYMAGTHQRLKKSQRVNRQQTFSLRSLPTGTGGDPFPLTRRLGRGRHKSLNLLGLTFTVHSFESESGTPPQQLAHRPMDDLPHVGRCGRPQAGSRLRTGDACAFFFPKYPAYSDCLR